MRTAEEKREAKNAQSRAWAARNPAKRKLANATRDKTKTNAASQAWRDKNPKYSTAYFAERKQVDELFKVQASLRSLVYSHFKRKGWGKETKTQELLGCTFEELAVHLQSKFKEGMTLRIMVSGT